MELSERQRRGRFIDAGFKRRKLQSSGMGRHSYEMRPGWKKMLE